MRRIRQFIGLVALFCGSSVAMAGTESTTFQVSARVLSACNTVTASALSFGNYNPLLSSDTSSTSKINVTCTSGTAFTVGLDAGNTVGSTVEQRLLTDGSGNNLHYNLYTSASHETKWGETSNTVSDKGTGRSLTETVYGLIPSGQTSAPQGSYTDTITVTVTY